MTRSDDILVLASSLRDRGEPFAMATVVRTVAVTAAKAGAKAVISADGTISGGWIGGGCARGAVLKAAAAALQDGQSRLVSVQPGDVLATQGLQAGESKSGVLFAANGCPSKGTMDIFVEPYLPRPHLAVFGASPVAIALVELARHMGFFVTVGAPAAEHGKFLAGDMMVDGFVAPGAGNHADYIVVATQGSGDVAALKAATAADARYVGFVGSRKKMAALRETLSEAGVPAQGLSALRAPAGLDLGAITPDEIAFSIVAEMIQVRRRGQCGERQKG